MVFTGRQVSVIGSYLSPVFDSTQSLPSNAGGNRYAGQAGPILTGNRAIARRKKTAPPNESKERLPLEEGASRKPTRSVIRTVTQPDVLEKRHCQGSVRRTLEQGAARGGERGPILALPASAKSAISKISNTVDTTNSVATGQVVASTFR